MNRIAEVNIVRVPQRCIDHVQNHLRAVGGQGFEGLGLWVGKQFGSTFVVEDAIIPAQQHIRTEDGVCVITGHEELHRINVWLYRHGLAMIAQIHSHPGRAYHSSTDDQYAVATTVGCLSLVVPDFARDAFAVERVASYRLDARGSWKALSATQARQLILIER